MVEAIETHAGVPVEPVHDLGEVFGDTWLKEVVDMVGHDTKGIEFEVELLPGAVDSVEDDFFARSCGEPELAAIAASVDVVAIAGLEVAWWSGHGISVEVQNS